MIKQRILVTGATGFLGHHLTNSLRNQNNLLCLTSSSENAIKQIEKMDLLDLVGLKKKIAEFKPTIIYHLGALVNLSRNFKIGLQCVDINIKGTFNLLESLRVHKPELFVFASTEEIYGKGPIPYKENQLPQPPSAYAVTKIAAENLCAIYAQELKFTSVIFRIGTMYGPYDLPTRFIPQIIVKALKNEDIPLNSGDKKRDYIYVEDVVKAFILGQSIKFRESANIINLGGGRSISLKDLTNIIIHQAESKSKIRIGEIPDREGEAQEWLLDNSLAHKLLNWKPQTSLEDGLNKTITYFRI